MVCVPPFFHSPFSSFYVVYTAAVLVLVFIGDEVEGASERGGVGGEPGDDGSERAMPGCDDALERERNDGPSKRRARCAAVQLPFIELVPPRARR